MFCFYLPLVIAAAATHFGRAIAQTPNSDPNCAVATDIFTNGGTVYYTSSDTEDFGLLYRSRNCTTGSSAQIRVLNLKDSTLVQCGYANLDGATRIASCPNFPRGSMAEVQYQVQFLLNPPSGVGVNFYVTHTQATSTAATPTMTVTSTPTRTRSETLTTTQTVTTFSSQETVTSTTGVETTQTITETPKRQTSTQTSVFVFTSTKTSFVMKQRTSTKTVKCRPMATALREIRVWKKRSLPGGTVAGAPKRLEKRDNPNTEGFAGAGDPTVTSTPAPAIATTTAARVTTTQTTTQTAAQTTTTDNPTPTVTIFTGSDVATSTTTLPQRTLKKTVYKQSTQYTTQTTTLTFTLTTTKRPKHCTRA